MTPSSATSTGSELADEDRRGRGLGDRGRRVLARAGSRPSTTSVHAFLTRTPEVALERAAELDAHRGTGAPQHAVAGIPLALKDVLATMGIRTTCGSKILENYVPPYDVHARGRACRATAAC